MSRTLIASDDFNRANGALAGANWANIDPFGGTHNIVSFKVNGGSGDGATSRWIGAGTFTDDQYSSVVLTLSGTQGGDWTGVCVRCGAGTDSNRSYYLFAVHDTAPTATFFGKLVTGSTTTFNTDTSISWSNGDRVEIECQGTTIRACKNGAALGGVWTVTDSSLTTNLPGIWSTGTGSSMDDWQAGSVTTTVGGSPGRLLTLMGVG